MILVQVFCAASANAADIVWTNVLGGDLETAGNWSAGVPGLADRPVFDRDGNYTVTLQNDKTFDKLWFRGSNSPNVTVGISPTKTWTWTGDASVIAYGPEQTNIVTITTGTVAVAVVILGWEQGSDGTINIVGPNSRVTANNEFRIGRDGTGRLNITNGVFDSSANLVVSRGGWGGTSIGYMNVNGGSVTCSTLVVGQETNAVGELGSGTFTLLDGNVTANNGVYVSQQIVGTLNISGGTFNQPGGDFYIASNVRGNGTVNISGGAVNTRALRAGANAQCYAEYNISGGTNIYTAGSFLVGQGAGSTGIVNVTGGELHATNDYTSIGELGFGTVTVSNDAVVRFREAIFGNASGSTGVLTVAGGSMHLTSYMSVGNQAGSTGAVYLTDGELVVTNNLIYVGNAGDGYMDISGGTNRFREMLVGQAAGTIGGLNISGGSNVFSTYLSVAPAGTGNATVSGGYLQITNQATYVSQQAGSVGTLNISGGTNRFRDFYVGQGAGSFGTVNISGGTNTFSHHIGLGNNSGSTGVLVMTGGDVLELNEWVGVGQYGKGEMIISNGVFDNRNGTISVGVWSGSTGLLHVAGGKYIGYPLYTRIGESAGATGTLRITAGEFYCTNDFGAIGESGEGYFYQSDGTSYWKDISIGQNASGTGLCVISGGELHITNGGTFRVGRQGRGHATVSGGTHYLRQLEVGAWAGSWGWMNMEGGTINLDPINEVFEVGREGTGTLYMTGGTIQQSSYGGGWAKIGRLAGSSGRVDLVGGDMIFNELWLSEAANSTGTLNIAGGNLTLRGSAGFPRYARGTVNVSAGTLSVSGQLYICHIDPAIGGMTVSGGSVVSTGTLWVAAAGNTKGYLTISGGSITVPAPSGMYVANGSSSTGTVTIIGTNATINFRHYVHAVVGGSEATTVYRMSAGGVSPIILIADCYLQGGTLTLGMKGYMDTVTTNVIPLINAPGTFWGPGAFATTNDSIFDVYKVSTTQYVARAKSTSKAGTGTVQNNGYQWLTSATNAGWIAMSTAGLSGTFTTYVRVDTNGASYTAVNLAAAMTAAGQTAYATNKFGDDWIAVTLPVPLNGTPSLAFDLTEYDSNITADVFSIGYIPNLYGSVFRFQ